MNKKLQVFVSSTYTDLIEERQAAVQAILDAGHIPAGMELFKAGKSQMETIRKWIDESDIYMLILGGRYGSIEEESGLSYTELEYKYALSKNMPVFAIVLDDSLLFTKAAFLGRNAIFEKDNLNKYDSFKKFVETKVVKPVSNIDQIPSVIKSQLDDISKDPDFNLNGWERGGYTFNKLYNIIEELLFQAYPIDIKNETTNFAHVLSNKIKNIISNSYGILNLSERIVKLSFKDVENHILNVEITKNIDYIYADFKNNPFKIHFHATEQQANTYNISFFMVDGKDITSKIKLKTLRNDTRGQLIYTVKSDPIEIFKVPTKIIYKSSYNCPAEDFFQSHRINALCKQFITNIILEKNVKEKYSLVCSTFSSFSNIHYDDIIGNEIFNNEDVSITLPPWSLPGSGYIATLKPKTKENYI